MTIMKKLTKSKQLVSIFKNESNSFQIDKEDYDFYSRLAKKLIPSHSNEVGLKCHLCQEEICPCCADLNDTLQLCESCGTPFHNCCITNYTIQKNIGIPHIFRCPKCEILSKIDQDEIVTPYEDPTESVDDYLKTEGNQPDLVDEFVSEKPEQFDIDESYQKPEVNPGETSQEMMQTVRIGGFFGKTYTIKKKGEKLICWCFPLVSFV